MGIMEILKAVSPRAYAVASFIGMALFFMAFPLGFVLGALWDGVRSGFTAGSRL